MKYLVTRFEALVIENEALKRKAAESEGSLEYLRTDNEEYRTRNSDLRTEVDILEARLSESREANANLRKLYDASAQRVSELLNKLAELSKTASVQVNLDELAKSIIAQHGLAVNEQGGRPFYAHKLPMIKEFRDKSFLGLKESKEYIEKHLPPLPA